MSNTFDFLLGYVDVNHWRGVIVAAFMVTISAVPVSATGAGPAFANRAADLPVTHVYDGGWSHFVGGGVALFDCDGDTLIDLFAAGGENPAHLLRNVSQQNGDIRMDAVPIPRLTGVTGAYPLDIDSDGHVDLMILRNGPNQLWKGAGDCTFTKADPGVPPGTGWSTAFSATWERGQHLPTLAIGNYVDATHPDAPFGTCDTNWLIRPDGARYGPPIPLEPAFCPLSMLFSDWQRSGTPMLRISNDRQYYVRDGFEQMWALNPLRPLTEADGWPRMQLWGMGIASHDISGDGLPEVMLTSMGDQMLMLNDGGRFRVAPFTTGTFAQRPFTGDDGRASTGWHAAFGDVNNDGRADLFIAKGNVDQMPDMAMRDPNNLLIQQADGAFAEHADTAGIASTERSRGAGLADLNNDGLLDIVVVNRRAPLEIWQNKTASAGNWLSVDPRQLASNTFAIGATIELRVDGRVQTIERTIGGGHVSGNLVPLHFGLGQADKADLRVIWPDGTRTDWQQVAANQALVIQRSAD